MQRAVCQEFRTNTEHHIFFQRDEVEGYLKRAKKDLREAEDMVHNLERDARRANITREEVTEQLGKSRKYGSELENKVYQQRNFFVPFK